MSQSDNEKCDNIYAKEGIAMWLNNKPKEAEEFFKKRMNSTQVLAGYAFTLCLVILLKILLFKEKLIICVYLFFRMVQYHMNWIKLVRHN